MNLVELNMMFKFLALGPVNLLMLHCAPSIIGDCGATVVQFRPGRQISNLKTQVQILAVALELIHELRGHSANIRKEDNKLQHPCVLEILLYYELKLLNLYDGKNV